MDKKYAVNIDGVREVRRIKEVIPVPGALSFIEGVVSLRGKVVPIINLRKKLGLPTQENKTFHRVLITEVHKHIIGLAIDSVIGVITFDPANIEPPDEVLNKADYLVGVGKSGKELTLIIDLEKLLTSDEKTGISHVHGKVQIQKKV